MNALVSSIRKASARYDLALVEVLSGGQGGTRRQDPIAHLVAQVVKENLFADGVENPPKNQTGIFVGCNSGGLASLADALQTIDSKISPHFVKDWFPATIQGVVSIQCGFQGVCKTFSSPCFSDLAALWNAALYVTNGWIDRAIVASCIQFAGNCPDRGLSIEAVLVELTSAGTDLSNTIQRRPMIDIQAVKGRVESGIVGPWIRRSIGDSAISWQAGEVLSWLVDEATIWGGHLPLECGIDSYRLWVLEGDKRDP